jgi:hypothetical protein
MKTSAMKKIIITTHFILLLSWMARSQSYEGTVNYQKKDEKVIVIEFPYPASVVEDAIVDKMEKLGFKKKESKGFLVYKNAILSDISSEPADYMIKVERKSRKDRDESIVYLLVSRNDENIIARSDALINSNAKTFLDRLSPDVDAFNLEVQIKDQESALAKAERKLKDMQDDQESMEKKIKKLQDDLKDNAKDQQNQQKEIEKQRQVLDSMKAKRKI